MGPGDSVNQTFNKTIHQLKGIRKFANFDATKKEMHKYNIVPSKISHLSQKQFNSAITMHHN